MLQGDDGEQGDPGSQGPTGEIVSVVYPFEIDTSMLCLVEYLVLVNSMYPSDGGGHVSK